MFRALCVLLALLLCSFTAEAKHPNPPVMQAVPPAPTVTMFISANSTPSYTAPASIWVDVEATDGSSEITKIQLYNNNVLVSTVTYSSVLDTTINNLAAGSYTIKAVATNSAGVTGSKSQTITISAPPNQAPSVSLGTPTGTFVAPASVGLSATASDSDGSISKVEFFANGSLVGTDTSAPYAITWSNVATGSYSVTAKATDNAGASMTSGATTVTVRAPVANAQYIGQTVATSMLAGGTQTVTVQMKNTGDLTWTSGAGYKLGSQNPSDNGTWGYGRVTLPSDIAPGQTATFTFTISAPTTSGSYNFQWRMLQEGVAWFGDTTPNVVITALAGTISASPNPCNIPYGSSTCATTISWASNAADAQVWVSALNDSNPQLFAQNQNGSASAPWIQAAGHRFRLKSGTQTLALVDVRGATAPSATLNSPSVSPSIAPATVNLTASASDSDGVVSKVEFYNGSTLLGTDTTAPYAYSWANVAAGTYSLTAKATDNDGASTTSAAQNVTISQTAVIGNVEEVRQVGNGYVVFGWACSTGRNQSIDVHLYAGGAAGSGTGVGAYTANLGSEPQVAQVCQAQGTAYRFQIPLTAAIRAQHGGKKIYIHGISPDGLGNLLIGNSGALSIPAPLAVTRRYVYDDNRQLCKVIEPETGSTVMQYDGAGNVVWSASGLALPDPNNCNRNEAWASNRVVLRDYDTRNRPKTLSFPDHNGDQTWNYWPDGLVKDITTLNDGGTTSVVNAYTYNKRRLLTGETQSQPNWYSWSLGYGYDDNDNLTSLVYPTQLTIDYAPNALGQPTKAGSYATGVSYYPNGGIKQFTYGNGIVHTMTQTLRQLPQRSISSGGALNDLYSYDANGNVESVIDELVGAGNFSPRSRWMSYDELDRLTKAGSCSFGGDCWHYFTYDSLDNLRSWKLAGVKDYASYYYDASNRLTNIQNSAGASIVGLGYDAQGNLQNKNGQNYLFDYGNRLRETTGKETYRYDGYGRRVLNWRPDNTLTLSQYSQSGQVVYQESSSKTLAIENIYLGGSLLASRERNWVSGATIATKYQHTDALGSPVAVTNESGQVIERTQYEPFGAAINKTVDGVGYAGHVMDAATGLTYMQQRYYDPGIGRFLSVDPVTANPNTGANFNRYVYAFNNPYKFTDPDGREAGCMYGPSMCGLKETPPEVRAQQEEMVNGLAGFIPGVDLYRCARGGCGAGGWTIAAIGIIPGEGKIGQLAGKSLVFKVAEEGGRHSGQLKQFMSWPAKQLERSVRSFDSLVAKHEGWIADPASKVKNWLELSPQHQANLIHHWEQDVARAKELKDLALEVLWRNHDK